MKPTGLFAKVFIGLAAGFVIIAIAVSAISDWQLDRSLTAEYRTKGEAIARSIASAAVELLLTRDASTIQAAIDQFLEIPGVAYVMVVDDRGDIVSHTFVPVVPAQVRALALERGEGVREDVRIVDVTVPGGGEYINVAAPILAGVAGWVHVGMDRSVIAADIRAAVLRLDLLLAGIFVIVLVVAYFLVNRTLRPLKVLTKHVQRLTGKDFNVVEQDGEAQAIADTAKDEVGELARAFLTMERELREHLKIRDELVGLRRELEIASTIQQSLLPKASIGADAGRRIDVYAEMIPAKEIGGDFYDFFPLGDGRLGLVVADVSGKGVPAALFMAVSRTLLKATALRGVGAGECLRQLNELLCVDSNSEMFVTVCYGILDMQQGTLEYATGGHYAPIFVRRSGEVVPLEKAPGLVIGMMDEIEFPSRTITLAAGDSILLFTDGVTEAMDQRGQLFSLERLTAAVKDVKAASSQELAQAVIDDVRRFSDGADQADDITVLTLTYLGAGSAAGAGAEVAFENV